MCIYWVQPARCNSHHKPKHKKKPGMLKFCTSHDHTSGKLEPESVHDMITFQGGAALSNKGKFYRRCMAEH